MRRLFEVGLNDITIPKFYVRVNGERGINSLADSVRSDGVVEPLVLRPSKEQPGKFELVCGLRRFLAAKKAGLKAVPCVVREMSDVEAMEAMLVENIHREDLTDYEVGRWFKILMDNFPDQYPNQQTVAGKFKLSVQQVNFLLKHYEFLKEMRKELPLNISTRVEMLPEGMVREVRRAPGELQPKILKAVVNAIEKSERGEKERPTVRDVAQLVDSYIRDWEAKPEPETFSGVIEKSLEAPKPEKPRTPGAPKPAPSPTPLQALPQKPAVLAEGEVERQLQETMRLRREAQTHYKESLAAALYKFYPEVFMRDLESHCGSDTPLEKLQLLAFYTIEIAWKNFLSDEEKLAAIREARSWMG